MSKKNDAKYCIISDSRSDGRYFLTKNDSWTRNPEKANTYRTFRTAVKVMNDFSGTIPSGLPKVSCL